jgi:hypothetical protein
MIFRGRFAVVKGVSRPYIGIDVRSVAGQWIRFPFLIDSGADATFLSQTCMRRVGIDPMAVVIKTDAGGVGGVAPHVEFSTQLRFQSESNETKIFVGVIGVFTDPAACDTPVLGRDVLDSLKMIFDRERDQILLLSPPHDYTVVTR